jgi:hypothetical protein
VVEAVEREGSKAVWVKRSDAKIPAKSLKQNNFLGKIFPYRTLTDSDGFQFFTRYFTSDNQPGGVENATHNTFLF